MWTNLCCGTQRDGSNPPHREDCPVGAGLAHWDCVCDGPYCGADCIGGWVDDQGNTVQVPSDSFTRDQIEQIIGG
jgi:hypothetical protein